MTGFHSQRVVKLPPQADLARLTKVLPQLYIHTYIHRERTLLLAPTSLPSCQLKMRLWRDNIIFNFRTSLSGRDFAVCKILNRLRREFIVIEEHNLWNRP